MIYFIPALLVCFSFSNAVLPYKVLSLYGIPDKYIGAISTTYENNIAVVKAGK